MIVLETTRLQLRQLSVADLEPLHRILSDPITMQFWEQPFTREATRDWIERNIQHYANQGLGRWAVTLKSSGELIGDCGIVHAEIAGALEYDLGYIIDHQHWGHGYATESAAACLAYGVSTKSKRRLVANMPVDHYASERVAQKIGMTWQKTFINARNRGILTHLYAYMVAD